MIEGCRLKISLFQIFIPPQYRSQESNMGLTPIDMRIFFY